MAYTTSPNMNLLIPGVGTEAAPTYAQDVNNSLTIIDSHNHSSGSGVQITPSGLNINSTLTMQGNTLLNTGSVNLPSLGTTPSNVSSIYATQGALTNDLYWYNGAGTSVQITSGSSIVGAAGTISGLPSGTASASYATGTFTFLSATTSPANISGGSYILQNSGSLTYQLTLSAPTLAASYGVVLPQLPGTTSVMNIDSSGNMGTTTSNVIAEGVTRSTGSTVGLLGVAVSSSCGSTSTTSTTPVQINNLEVIITTSGRPVMVACQPDGNGSGNPASFVGSANEIAYFLLVRDGTEIARVDILKPTGTNQWYWPPSALTAVDVVAAGTHTYQAQYYSSGGTASAGYMVLVAYEL